MTARSSHMLLCPPAKVAEMDAALAPEVMREAIATRSCAVAHCTCILTTLTIRQTASLRLLWSSSS